MKHAQRKNGPGRELDANAPALTDNRTEQKGEPGANTPSSNNEWIEQKGEPAVKHGPEPGSKSGTAPKTKARILWDLFITFFKIGAFTIGGGLAMLPIIEREIVEKKQYINREEIVDAFAVSQSLPGIIAINSAIYVGYRIAGLAGAFVTALGVILPSFITIIVIAMLFTSVSGNVYVNKALTGVKAGVAGVIAVTVVKLGKQVIKEPFAIVLAVISFILAVSVNVSVVFIILGGALLGYLYDAVRRAGKHGAL